MFAGAPYTHTTDVIIIALADAAGELRSYVHEIYKGKVSPEWHFLTESMGTAEALLQIKDKIRVSHPSYALSLTNK